MVIHSLFVNQIALSQSCCIASVNIWGRKLRNALTVHCSSRTDDRLSGAVDLSKMAAPRLVCTSRQLAVDAASTLYYVYRYVGNGVCGCVCVRGTCVQGSLPLQQQFERLRLVVQDAVV